MPVFKRKFFPVLGVIIFLIIANANLFGQHPKKSQRYFDKALNALRADELQNAQLNSVLAIEQDTLNIKAYLLLSDICAELKNDLKYQWALNKVIQLNSGQNPLVYKLLGNSYFASGNYSKALDNYLEYFRFGISKDSVFINDKIQQCKWANNLVENAHPIEIIHLDTSINSSMNEYWPFISTDDSTLYFTRLVTNEKPYPFERLFFSERTLTGWLKAQKLTIGNPDEVNEGTLSMTADGRLIFFTACGQPDGKGSCDIYYMKEVDGVWKSPQNAGSNVNTSMWDAQPSVSSKGEALYWSSNRGGGFGVKDIWMASISIASDGLLSFGDAINLGEGVNSEKNDYSPFIHADNQTLYFASDGRYGLGKSDLFVARYLDSVWALAQNLGYPINSIGNDDGLVVSPTAHVALFSSDRIGSINNSKDLYFFNLPNAFLPAKMGYVKGFVYNALTNEKLNALIEVTNLNSEKSWAIAADPKGGYIITVESLQNYAFNINKKGYLIFSEHFNLQSPQNFCDATIYNIYLQPIGVNATVVLKNIFFEFGSYELNKKSIAELMLLVEFLKQNRKVKIEISGHTDSVGNKDYNQSLSEERAKAISLFLEENIGKGRISYFGYGDQKPVESNDTEDGRAKNRRSELRVTAY